MPLYEYYCPTCNVRFERLRPMSASADPVVCPEGHEGALRTVSVISAIGKGESGQAASFGGGCACGGACSCR